MPPACFRATRAVRHSAEEHFLVHLEESEYRRRVDDPEVRPWIDLVRAEEAYGITLLEGMESGRIRRVAIHGDTKLDNFLFSTRTGRVKALVDLDTIMPHTWLADWGDMVRSLVNVAGEKERDLSRVRVDMDVYRAVARGFLSTAREVTPAEVDLMADAPQIIALELGLRFLTDFLRGDSYFTLGPADPPDLNRARAMAQLTLFLRFRECRDETRRFIDDLRAESTGAGSGIPADYPRRLCRALCRPAVQALSATPATRRPPLDERRMITAGVISGTRQQPLRERFPRFRRFQWL